jgi:Putative lactococcus lactis phage r1t holin
MFTLNFWKAAGERAIKSAAQGALLMLAMSDSGVLNLFDLDVGPVVGGALGGALLSLLTSIASAALPIGPDNSPSLTNADPR